MKCLSLFRSLCSLQTHLLLFSEVLPFKLVDTGVGRSIQRELAKLALAKFLELLINLSRLVGGGEGGK